MNNKVIFVGGTSFSGSTMLDMILSNDPHGNSLGEIIALFRPHREHHFQEIKKLKTDKDWLKILDDGEKNLYQNLFNIYNNTEYFVDSSKDPNWIKKNIKILKNNNIDFKNVLIYKTPAELAHSFAKRNKINILDSHIEAYYKTYLYYIKDFRSVSYKQLVKEPKVLELLCNYLQIDYFIGKEKFWQKEHHTFFGNRRARVHTDNLKPEDKNVEQNLTKDGYQKLYYVEPDNEELMELGKKIELKYKNIFEYIYSKNITPNNSVINYYPSHLEMKKKWMYSKSKFLINNFKAKVNKQL